MGIVSSGVKKLTRGAVKKTAKKSRLKENVRDVGILAGTTAAAVSQVKSLKKDTSEMKAKLARKKLATGAKKFGPRGRR